MTDRELLEFVANEIQEMKSDLKETKEDINLIKTQQSEYGEMIQSLIYASETQKAQNDALQMEFAKLSGEMRQGFTDITEVQKSLVEM